MAAAVEKEVKPVYEWGLDPIHWAHAKLFVCDILGLKEGTVIAGTLNFSSQPYFEWKNIAQQSVYQTVARSNSWRMVCAYITLTNFNLSDLTYQLIKNRMCVV